MNEIGAIFAIIVGITMIVCGFTIKQFYESGGMFGAGLSDREIPRWLGRFLFVFIGSVMLLVGIKFFFFGH